MIIYKEEIYSLISAFGKKSESKAIIYIYVNNLDQM